MKKNILFTFLLFCISGILPAQQPVDKAQLEKERQEIQQEIKAIQENYDKVKGQKRQIIGQYNLLDRKIKLQNRYISNINKEIRLIDNDIYMSNVEVYRLNRQLDTLKAQYSRSVVYAYKNRSTYDFLNFIFSAGSFNDAIKRIAYLKSYRSYREQQVNNIKETQVQIDKRKQDLVGKKKTKDDALQNQTEQAKVLETQKKEKDVVLSNLKSQEKDLEKQLAAKRKRDQSLKNQMAAIVRREMEAARKKAEEEAARNAKPDKPTTTGPTTSITGVKTKPETEKTIVAFNTEEDKIVSGRFEDFKGRLPWPVDQGYVCTHFGTYQIENTKLRGDNQGVTICTESPGVNVKSVFDGEVVSVFNVGDSKAVMIRHGKYFTVYSNLGSANTTKGAEVKTGQVIGKVGQDEDDGVGGKLEFLLMIESKNVNPEVWLRNR